MDKRAIQALAILAGGSLLYSCAAPPPGSGLRASSSGFVLTVWEESFLGAAPCGEFSLQVQPCSDGGAEVSVAVADARSLRALYFDVEYDPAQWHPVAAEPVGALGSALELLSLPHLREPGRAYLGQVLIRPQEQAGFSGGGLLARLSFAAGPAPADSRQASAPGGPPSGPGAAPQLFWERQLEPVLRWRTGGPGDYDQNGEVNIADLTPLGQHYGESGWFAPLTQLAAVDGDGNGEINLADITTIGSHYGEVVEGYNVYALTPPVAAASVAHKLGAAWGSWDVYPIGAVDQPQAPAAAFHVQKDAGAGLPAPEQETCLWYESGNYYLGTTPGLAGSAVWLAVEPHAAGQPGEHSNIVGGAPVQTQVVLDPPVAGTGTRLDPFVLPAAETEYTARLVHPVEGDVTAPYMEQLTWVLEDARAADELPILTRVLEVQARPEIPGWRVSRLALPLVNEAVIDLQSKDDYNQLAPPGQLYFHLEDGSGANRPPIAVLHVNPAVPVQGQPFTLDATASVDPEGGALTYEFDPEGDGSFEPGTTEPEMVLPGIFSPTAEAILRLTDNLGLVRQAKLEYCTAAPASGGPEITLLNPADGADVFPLVPIDVEVQLSDDTGLASCTFSIAPAEAGSFEKLVVNLDAELNASITNRFDPGVVLGFAICTVTGEDVDGNVSTLSFGLNVTEPNSPPIPSLSVVPNPPREGDEIFLDASGSFDTDGTIEICRFDFENDGTWDTELSAPAEFRVAHAYTEGAYTAKIELEDNLGAVNQIPAQLSFSVLPKLVWEVQVVCGGGAEDMGKHCSLARIGGNPAIAFQDVGAKDLTFVRSFDNYGNDWGFTPYTAAQTDGVNDGLYAAMTHVSGGQPPLVLYYDADNGNLMAVRAFTEAGSNWLAPVVVDGAGSDAGKGISQVMLGGKAAAVYYSETGLFFVTATDAGGLTWNAPVPVASGVVPADPVSDLFAPGGGEFPHAIGSFDDGLEFLGAGDSNGDAWQSSSVALATVSNAVTSLDSFPGVRSDAISYVDAGSGELRFELPVGGDKTDWSGPHQVAGLAGPNPQRMDGGLFGEFLWSTPHFIIAVGADNGLTIYESTDDTGQSWKAPFVLDASAGAGSEGLSMSWVLGFNPVICWYAPATGELKYAIYR